MHSWSYSLVYLSAMSNEVLLSDNDESSSSDNDISLPDLTKLQPYEFEPFNIFKRFFITFQNVLPSRKRLGNTNWCQCGNCRPMATETESLCCAETNEVADDMFEGF